MKLYLQRFNRYINILFIVGFCLLFIVSLFFLDIPIVDSIGKELDINYIDYLKFYDLKFSPEMSIFLIKLSISVFFLLFCYISYFAIFIYFKIKKIDLTIASLIKSMIVSLIIFFIVLTILFSFIKAIFISFFVLCLYFVILIYYIVLKKKLI